MTVEAAATISNDRVRTWIHANKRAALAATPVLMLCVDHNNRGQLSINTVEAKELSDEKILVLLQEAVVMLRSKITKGN